MSSKIVRGNLTQSQQSLVAIIGAVKGICRNIMETRIYPAMDNLRGCKSKRREKRSLVTFLGAAGTAASFITGVSDLLKGLFYADSTIGKLQALDDLTKRVNEATKTFVLDRSTMGEELEKDLAVMSESASKHLAELRDEAVQIPTEEWLMIHMILELYAGAANIRAIEKDCHQGRLATTEIAEMLEKHDFRELDNDDTILEYLVVSDDRRGVVAISDGGR